MATKKIEHPDAKTLRELLITSGSKGGELGARVLVGGMAVDSYRALYGISSEVPNLTRDIDYFGGRADIDDAAKLLKDAGEKIKIFVATMDDHTPNSGKIAVYREGMEPIEIDFLYRINNVSDDDIVSAALTLTIDGNEVRVVNPLILMEMKIGNLAFFPSKRDAEGVDQARIAVAVTRRYLEDFINSKHFERRRLLDQVERIIRFSARDASCCAMSLFGVDSMDIISPKIVKACGSRFSNTRLPQVRDFLKQKREKFDRMIESIRFKGNHPERMRF